MFPSIAFLSLLWVVVRADVTSPVASKGTSYLINETTTFRLPPGLLHIRVLAVGGGGAGCVEAAFAKGKASVPKVKIIHLNGSVLINITVGRGGINKGDGTSSRFGNYLEAMGGKGCKDDYTNFSLKSIRGINNFRLSSITKGRDGKETVHDNVYAAGGEGGILINGKGPTAFPGSHLNSGRGGKGFGAGGGSEAYTNDATSNRGGDGAPGVVYFELSQGCHEDLDIIFAVELMKNPKRFKQVLNSIVYILDQTFDRNFHAKVGLIVFRNQAKSIFPPGAYENITDLKKAIANATNLNDSSDVSFGNLFHAADAIFADRSHRRRHQVLAIFTNCTNIVMSKNLNDHKKSLLTLPVSIIVVNLHQNPSRHDLNTLATNDNGVFNMRNVEERFHVTPWIVDFICKAPKPSVTSSIKTFTIRPTTLSLDARKVTAVMGERTAQFSTPKITIPIQTVATVVLPLSSSLPDLLKQTDQTTVEAGHVTVTRCMQKTETVIPTTAAYTLSSSTIAPVIVKGSIKTDEITEKKQMADFQRMSGFDMSAISIANIEILKAFLTLVGELLSNKYKDGGIEKRLQVLKIVELVSMKLASQMVPDAVKGYSMLDIKSKTIALKICAVMVNASKKLLLMENKGENYTDQREGVTIPTSIFSTTKEEAIGRLMVLTYPPFDGMNEPDTTTVGSPVMNLVAKPTTTMPFKKPVEMIFPVDEHLKEQSRCMFWNTTRSKTVQSPNKWWDETGCKTIRVSAKRIVCHCNHLTNFAVITRVKDYPRSKGTELSLTIITYIGISLSLLGCVLTISTYVFLPSLWSDRTTINVQLVVAILISQTLFLASTFAQQNKTLCFVMAVVTYYFYLSVFTWMLVEGVHIYCKVVRVYQTNRIRRRVYFLFGWGIPVLSTTLSAGAFRERFVSSKHCWLSIESGAVWTFVGQVVFVVLVNFAILCIVMRISTQAAKDDKQVSSRALVKGFVALLPILGLTWVFGLLAVNSSTVVFEYIFAILNSMQGFLIFIFCCVANSEVQREFNRKLRNIRARRNPSFNSSQSRSANAGQGRSPKPATCLASSARTGRSVSQMT